jgi:putative ABC transport system permease protein
MTSAPWYQGDEQNWDSSFLYTYVLLADKTNPDQLEQQFPAFIEKTWDKETANRTNFKLMPFVDLYNAQYGSRKYAYILLGISLVIILIASINFMNIATARSLERVREIGIRKVLGAYRHQITRQYLGEAVLITFVSLLIAIFITELALPVFNNLYDIQIQFRFLNSPVLFFALIIFAIFIGTIAGIYPALFLSRFSPTESLYGKLKNKAEGLRIRHGLLIFQFAMSIILIVGTAVIIEQVRYMKQADVGFDKENIIVIPINARDFADSNEAVERIATYKNEISKLPGVVSTSSSAHVPGDWGNWFTFAYPEGSDPSNPMRVRFAIMDDNYFNTYKIKFLSGRNFLHDSKQDQDQSIILNEAAVKEFGWQDGVGKTVRRGETIYNVVGVVENYNFESLETEVKPVLHVYRPPDNRTQRYISVRLSAGADAAALAKIEDSWKELAPARDFNYFFVDKNLNRLYQTQDRLSKVTAAFTILAIFISCMGLFGLSALSVSQRTKEIGIRKVLGASFNNISYLLFKDYIRLLIVAFVLATPVAYFLMQEWLQNFAYRVDISWWIFIAGGMVTFMVAVITMGWQAMRAASTNPVDSLRYE